LPESYKELACAIIRQAVEDSRDPNPDIREDAIEFVNGRLLEAYIALFQLSLNPAYIRRKIKE
jgi:hypothetical protein